MINWIKIEDEKPKPNTRVLVYCNYEKYNRKNVSHIAEVHYSEKYINYGGPMSLTGKGKLIGIYFAIPAILSPETVTHWYPLTEPVV
jgi:predicted Co/Zn/Cd cation transporter (cation efflux family)